LKQKGWSYKYGNLVSVYYIPPHSVGQKWATVLSKGTENVDYFAGEKAVLDHLPNRGRRGDEADREEEDASANNDDDEKSTTQRGRRARKSSAGLEVAKQAKEKTQAEKTKKAKKGE